MRTLLTFVAIVWLNTILHSQTYTGRIYWADKNGKSIDYEYDQISLQINPDSTVIYTRVNINTHRKHKRAYFRFDADSIIYHFGWIRTVNDSTRKILTDDTYAVSYGNSLNHSHSVGWIPDNDTMLIQFDSIRLFLPDTVRIIYENGTDTTYNVGELTYYHCDMGPCDKKLASDIVGSWQRTCILYLPLNEKFYGESRYLFVDIGLINPQTREPLLYKVDRGSYPIFMNWNSYEQSELTIINGKAGYRLEELIYGPVDLEKVRE